MVAKRPCYELVHCGHLQQGDLLAGLTVPVPFSGTDMSDDAPEYDFEEVGLVVLTQSCDIEQEKVADIVLCLQFTLDEARKSEPKLAQMNVLKEIRSGRRPRFCLLPACNLEGFEAPLRVVDFGRVHSLPRPYIERCVEQSTWPRLCSPYREHLSQAFGSFFMRVGLPEPIEIPKIELP